MKPQTLEVFADISVESIKKETEELIAAVGFAVDSSDFRDCATTCRNILNGMIIHFNLKKRSKQNGKQHYLYRDRQIDPTP